MSKRYKKKRTTFIPQSQGSSATGSGKTLVPGETGVLGATGVLAEQVSTPSADPVARSASMDTPESSIPSVETKPQDFESVGDQEPKAQQESFLIEREVTSTPISNNEERAMSGSDETREKKSESVSKNESQDSSSERLSHVGQEYDPSRDYSKEPLGARIRVIGVGGAGGNAVNNMIRSGLKGVEFIAANTDVQALRSSEADVKLQLGEVLTKGLGAGANPSVGEAAALESQEEIRELLRGADMVLVTAGMGGGTGGGGAAIVAKLAREVGALTVGVVTRPFIFEGKRRAANADIGMEALKREVDTLITIPNQRLLSVAGRNSTLLDTFRKADDVLYQAVKGISDLILFEGLVNVDFADVKSVMSEMGMAMMGSGEASGENRAIDAAEKAISSPLLEDVSIHGARGILINVTAGEDVTLQEINEAAELIHAEAHDEANIIWGMVIDPALEDSVRVTVIATGFGDMQGGRPMVRGPQTGTQTPFQSSGGSSSYGSASFGSGSLGTGMYQAAAPSDPNHDKKFEIPTFSRKQKEASPEQTKLKKLSVMNSSEDEEKYEIPTFLRRQAD